jgi:hypothetical protein
MKKNFSLKIFNLIAKRVYKISKKRKLGWTWQQCQKWTSVNLFKSYKGKSFSKIKVTDVDKDVIAVIEGKAMPISGVTAKKIELCFNINQVTNDQTDDIGFYYLHDRIFGGENGEIGFDDNLKIAVEVDGLISTGLIKKYQLSSSEIKKLISDIRKLNLSSTDDSIIFKRVLISDKISEINNPCNGYILITMLGSSADLGTVEIDMDVKEKDLTPELQAKIEEAKKLDEANQEAKRLKKKAINTKRPSQVEPKKVIVQPTAKTESEEKSTDKIQLETERYNALNRTLEILEQSYDKGLITKKQFQDRQQQIFNKFEKGGQI